MSGSEKIKVLLVDDSVLVRKYLTLVFSSLDYIEVVGTAPNGRIGLQKLFLFKPDIMILDVEMPEMTGLDVLKYIKEKISPENRPKVIMFSSLMEEGSSATFEALANGAAEFIKKPEGQISDNIEFLTREFDIIIKGLYESGKGRVSEIAAAREKAPETGPVNESLPLPDRKTLTGLSLFDSVMKAKPIKPVIIAIGSSTGGPVAIRKILDNMGKVPVPVVIAQHMPAGFTSEFAKNLKAIYHREVLEARDGEEMLNGNIYICPGGVHSLIEKKGNSLFYKSDPKSYDGFFFKPSVDIFFKSVNQSAGKNVLGIVLSGMGKDGSIESVKLRDEGAIMIAQDRESSVVWGMPGSSVRSGGIDIIIDISDIGIAINNLMAKS